MCMALFARIHEMLEFRCEAATYRFDFVGPCSLASQG